MLWGHDFNDYNTVAEKPFVISFWYLQLFRFMSFLILIILFMLYGFIYMINVFKYMTTYVCMFSILTFAILFREAGRQKCYQIKLYNPKYKIFYSDKF